MIINEHVLKLTGKVSLPQELQNFHNYRLAINGSITAKTEEDNHDNTCNMVYKFEPVLVEVLSEKGEIIRAKDKRKMSQKLRGRLYMIYSDPESKATIPFDEWYEQMMGLIISKVDEIIT